MTESILKEMWNELKASVAGWKIEPRRPDHGGMFENGHNPATGLPMSGVGGSIDVAGNPKGSSLSGSA